MSQLKITDFEAPLKPPAPPAEPEPIIPPPAPALRPYQEEAYEAWVSRGRRGVVIAPTGTGKTVIAIHAIKTANTNTLVVVPTERILKTWMSAFRRFGLTATAYYGRFKMLSGLTVSIYNSVALHPEILDHFKMVVFDEVHHVASEVFSKLLEMVDGKDVMSLTATLKREDGLHHIIMAKLPVVYALDLKTAVESGYVSPIDIIPVPAPLTKVEMQGYTAIERKIRQLQQEIRFRKLLGKPVKELERRLHIILSRRRQFLSHVSSKREKTLEVVRKEVNADRILLFSESITSIEWLKEYLVKNGVPTETYHSLKSEAERDQVFEGWGSRFKVLLAVRALDEGVDVPEVGVGVIIASGKSTRQLVQRQGRLLRPAEGKRARLYVIYAENTYEYGIFLKIKGILKGWVRPY